MLHIKQYCCGRRDHGQPDLEGPRKPDYSICSIVQATERLSKSSLICYENNLNRYFHVNVKSRPICETIASRY